MQGFPFFLRRIDRSCFAERNDGAVVHGMVENRTREDKTVGESDRNANGKALTEVAEHTAGGGAVEVEGVTHAGEQRGNHVGLAIHGESDVAHKSFVENFVNGFAIIDAAVWLAHHARALARRSCFGHNAPRGETGRGAYRLAMAHLISSRRHCGMYDCS